MDRTTVGDLERVARSMFHSAVLPSLEAQHPGFAPMPGTGRTGRWRRYMAAALRHRATVRPLTGCVEIIIRRAARRPGARSPADTAFSRQTMDSAHHRLLTILWRAQYRVSRGRTDSVDLHGRSCARLGRARQPAGTTNTGYGYGLLEALERAGARSRPTPSIRCYADWSARAC